MPKLAFQESGFVYLWLSLIGLVADQATKLWIVAEFELFAMVEVFPSFNLVHVRNYGAAFSFLSDAGGWQRWFFTVVAIVISVLILWWLRQLPKTARLEGCGYALILGGALGNVYDRLQYGYVIDFLDFYYGEYHWPAFNIADTVIFCGAACLIINMLLEARNKHD